MGIDDKTMVYQDLDRLLRFGSVSSTDGSLLGQFLSDRDEIAFETLVDRHGPMVRGICQRLLHSSHDADDAFQATFLVLVRKAGHLRDPDRLGPWLHGVATRVASKARSRACRRREVSGDDRVVEAASSEIDKDWHDLMPIIDVELEKLPSKHRDVLVLCLLKGQSVEDASRQLACPVGTVKSRLARAREALRSRLVSRGIAPAVAVAAVGSARSFASPVGQTLIRDTLAIVTAQVVSPAIVALTRGAAPSMLPKSTALLTTVAGTLAVAAVGTTVWLNPSLAQNEAKEPPPQATALAIPTRTPSQAETDKHLKQILLAVHNYILLNEHLPSSIHGSDRRPKLSWRVAILPFLGETDLYRQFHLNEPWDSPHNKTLIARMPDVFKTPHSLAPDGQTRFRGFAGKGTLFDPFPVQSADVQEGGMGAMMGGMSGAPGSMMGGNLSVMMGGETIRPGGDPQEKPPGDNASGGKASGKETERMEMMLGGGMGEATGSRTIENSDIPAIRFADITDGTSNTVLLAVARDATPWTKPGELVYIADQELPALDESDPAGYLLGMMDGSSHILRREIPAEVFPALLSRNGGEVISHDCFETPPTPPGTAENASPTPLSMPTAGSAFDPEALNRRLQSVEQKLDRLLERLGATEETGTVKKLPTPRR